MNYDFNVKEEGPRPGTTKEGCHHAAKYGGAGVPLLRRGKNIQLFILLLCFFVLSALLVAFLNIEGWKDV